MSAILSISGLLPGAAPPPPAPTAPTRPRPAPTHADLNRPWPRSSLDEAEVAGLPRGSRAEVLDWERIYDLALIRGRSDRPADGRDLAESLDPKALAEQAERYDVGDFARFRKEFLAGTADDEEGDGRFRDPSAEALDLMRRLEAVIVARWNIASIEMMVLVLRDLIQEASWGLSQIHLDRVEGSLQQARLRFVDEREHYLDQLDALKVHLGLAPHAPIVPDQRILAGFRDTFEENDRWCADPKREMTELPHIVGSLPALDDIVIDGHSARAVSEDEVRSDAVQREEEILSAGVKVALANHHRGDQDKARLELRVRRALRRLLRIRVAYKVEKRRFVLVTRRRDQAQERLLAPPRLATPRKGESQVRRREIGRRIDRIPGRDAGKPGPARLALDRIPGTAAGPRSRPRHAPLRRLEIVPRHAHGPSRRRPALIGGARH